ncbi:hypothetical protein O7621_05075 [Solwaraspora sp. WMMD937]|uniref:hypothetical protein n=1 Tax=Solwaraspora sp. WMMD937 TaxID=3016090 RepID=UPI00249B36D4|nr:hypothetical protein [Solwaraspora sp. WMMD937]WFE22715.1 hypothetical protein O7621_05075 [Solwaraspora sp. WMMD937]
MQHTDCADRVRNLGMYLQAALLQAQSNAYLSAFATLRTALEHMLVDHLVFSGARYIRVIRGVDDATWSEWQRKRAAAEEFTDVIDWVRKKTDVEITTEGLRSAPDDGGQSYIISPHYFLLREYQPYLGPASAQAEFDDGIGDLADDRKFAKENDHLYRTYLSWSSIKKNLLSNDFVDEKTITMIEVHYRFLSSFVHPIADVTEIVYGRNNSSVPSYDHYSSELVLLYVIVIAVEELNHFHEMAQRYPVVGIAGWSSTMDLCRSAWQLASHLWFPGHRPHRYDYIQEANTRAFRLLQEDSSGEVQREDPMSIPEDEVRYYRDPMRRLVALHGSFSEIMSGYSYISPWPRPDARFR